MKYALEVVNVEKSFIGANVSEKDFFFHHNIQKSCVLKNVSLKIKQGCIFGIAVLNGMGKTTMIKIILDLLKPDSGFVKVFNQSNFETSVRKNIYYLPEKFLPSQYLTGYEFLLLSLYFYNKKLDKNKAHILANKIDLSINALGKVIKTYSKGMRQKLGLMACILSDAKLLILDEPMTGLDPMARIALKSVLKEYKNHGGTIFFSSHILDDIEEICDELAILHNGEIKFQGQPLDFIDKYQEQKAEKAFLKCIS